MKTLIKKNIFIGLACVGCIIIFLFFSPVFVKGKVPFPSNLQVSLYSPWKYIPDPDYPNGPPNKPMGFDNIRQIFPYKEITRDSLKKGILPLWNPYIFSGAPHLAAYDSAVLYPLNIVTILFQPMTAWTILVIIQPILAGFFMLLLLRKLQFPMPAQLFGSFTYAFSGWMIGYWEEALVLEHTALWMPLLFYGSLLVWEEERKLKGFVLLVVSLVSAILAGFFQIALYVIVSSALWNGYLFIKYRYQKKSGKSALYVLLAYLCAMMITSMQWVPSLEAFFLSTRSAIDSKFLFDKYLLPFEHIITFLIPDFWGNPGAYNYFSTHEGFYFEKLIYIGVIPFVFALFAFWKSSDRYSNFWKIFSIVCLSLGFALPTSWIFYYFHIPVLSSALPTRIFGIFCFFVSVLSAYGYSMFIKNKEENGLKQILGFLTAVLFGIWIFIGMMVIVTRFEQSQFVTCGSSNIIGQSICRISLFVKKQGIRYALYGSVTLRNMILPTVFLASAWIVYWLRSRSMILVYGITGISLICSSFYFASKATYFSESRFTFPETAFLTKLKQISGYNRVWGYGNAFFEKNVLVPYKIYSTDGYGAIFSSEYAEFLSSIRNNGTIDADIRRSDADLFEVSEREALGSGNAYRLRVMSLLGVRYIVETKKGPDKEYLLREDRFPDTMFTLSYEDDTWRIWEYRDALPRAFFASNIEVETDRQKLLDRIYDSATDLQHTVFISSGKIEKHEQVENESPQRGIVNIISYEPSKVVLSVEAPVYGVVFLSDTYYPGWVATVDGKTVEILKANYAFRAVPVEAGNHTIEFTYQPKSVRVGYILTVVGFIIFVALISIIKIASSSGVTSESSQ